MSYVTYTTEALVCGSYEQNIADKSFLLFTREAGMLFATARSVRAEGSKQRYALQEFSQIRVSLIKGKQGWRVGSVEAVKNDFSAVTTREARASIIRLYKLLRRFIRGEEASVELYDFVIEALAKIADESVNRKLLDLYIHCRVLLLLGYVDPQQLPPELVDAVIDTVAKTEDEKLQSKLEKLVLKATDSSHL